MYASLFPLAAKAVCDPMISHVISILVLLRLFAGVDLQYASLERFNILIWARGFDVL